MIPLGAVMRIPSGIQQPVMALLAGMILVAVSGAIVEQTVRSLAPVLRLRISAYAVGALIGGVSCLIA